jgi:transcriptional regulator GlxA family with amidase domain
LRTSAIDAIIGLMAPVRRVVIVAFPECMSLDVVGPAEVFSSAGPYEVEVVAPDPEPFFMTNGMQVVPAAGIDDVRGAIDTLVIAGGEGTRRAATDPRVIAWVQDAAARSRRVTSVCSGAFVLANAGLLDGRRATTHWQWCDTLAAMFPAVDVERDAIFVADGNTYTSAGVTAGIDLALALVEEDLGRDVALAIARHLVMFLRRPGGQRQFSVQLAAQVAARDPLRDVQRFAAEHPGADLSVPALARRANLSPRQFSRAFAAEVGTPPGRYVDQVRLEAARRLLEERGQGVEEVARTCGYGTPEAMRRAFVRELGVGPADYRERF